jgi:FKBP-type peptidyl-prolyl cis-trans isomerase 2
MRENFLIVRGFVIVFLLLSATGCKTVDLSKTPVSQETVPSLQADSKKLELNQGQIVSSGNTVLVQFVARLANGKIVGRTEDGKALTVVAGERSQMPGLEMAVIGMHVNETKNVRIEAQNAFGIHNENLVRKFERAAIPSDIDPVPGMVLSLTNENGKNIAATVIKVEDDFVHVDLNHPLAGKDIFVSVKILAVQ